MTTTPVHHVATVGDLEKLIRQLKRSGEITAKTRVTGIDVDGSSGGKGPAEVRVFHPNGRGLGEHTLALWGSYE